MERKLRHLGEGLHQLMKIPLISGRFSSLAQSSRKLADRKAFPRAQRRYQTREACKYFHSLEQLLLDPFNQYVTLSSTCPLVPKDDYTASVSFHHLAFLKYIFCALMCYRGFFWPTGLLFWPFQTMEQYYSKSFNLLVICLNSVLLPGSSRPTDSIKISA